MKKEIGGAKGDDVFQCQLLIIQVVFLVMHVVNDTTELNMTFATHRMVSDGI